MQSRVESARRQGGAAGEPGLPEGASALGEAAESVAQLPVQSLQRVVRRPLQHSPYKCILRQSRRGLLAVSPRRQPGAGAARAGRAAVPALADGGGAGPEHGPEPGGVGATDAQLPGQPAEVRPLQHSARAGAHRREGLAETAVLPQKPGVEAQEGHIGRDGTPDHPGHHSQVDYPTLLGHDLEEPLALEGRQVHRRAKLKPGSAAKLERTRWRQNLRR
mmetsp:Transcript_12599/g.39352  ORF Transcript_12599/g.39352 Transcript_12599/m.39352 type:complete len:219 (+) Transcript_12599:470-1126(+)